VGNTAGMGAKRGNCKFLVKNLKKNDLKIFGVDGKG
jgi:hypothetical protein